MKFIVTHEYPFVLITNSIHITFSEPPANDLRLPCTTGLFIYLLGNNRRELYADWLIITATIPTMTHLTSCFACSNTCSWGCLALVMRSTSFGRNNIVYFFDTIEEVTVLSSSSMYNIFYGWAQVSSSLLRTSHTQVSLPYFLSPLAWEVMNLRNLLSIETQPFSHRAHLPPHWHSTY